MPHETPHPAGSAQAPVSARGGRGGLSLILVLAVVAVYGQVAGFDFVEYDTQHYLTRNGAVQRGITPETIGWAFTSFHIANWHPLTWLSHALDVSLFGFQPGAHLLHNVALHALNTVLVFLLFARWTGNEMRSALVAALFGLHPMHVESVAWIVERKDVLSTCYGLFFLHAWTSWVRAPSLGRYALAWILFALGLMAKPMVITLPALLLLLDVWPLARTDVPLARRIREKLPFAPLMLASAWVTSMAQHAWGAMSSVEHIGLGPRLANALWAWPSYVSKLLWPSDLLPYYPWRDLTGEPATVLLASAVFAVACVLALAFRKRSPWLFTGWVWFVGMLVPVIGILQVGDQAMADRYTYLPSVGLFAALVWLGAEILARRGIAPRWRVALGIALVVASAFLCSRQVGYWRDTETLARRGLAIDPDNVKMHVMLGQSLSERALFTPNRLDAQRLQEAALAEFQAVLEMQPNSVDDLCRAGYLLTSLGRFAEAEPHLRRAVELEPRNAQALNYLGVLYLSRENDVAAELWLRQAVAIDPENAQALNNLGLALERQDRLAEAEAMSRRALAAVPSYVRAQLRLAVQLRKQGRIEEAAAALERAGEMGVSAFDRPAYDAEVRRVRAAKGAS